MRKIAAAAALLFASCASVGDLRHFELRPGAKLNRHVARVGWLHKGGTLCAYDARVHGIEFNVDVACDHDVILYVQTFDPKFRTAERLSIGRPMSDALAAGGRALTERDDDGEGVLLPSGWIARPWGESKIQYFDSPFTPSKTPSDTPPPPSIP